MFLGKSIYMQLNTEHLENCLEALELISPFINDVKTILESIKNADA